MIVETAALIVACPACGAQPGDRCTRPNGKEKDRPHAARTHDLEARQRETRTIR